MSGGTSDASSDDDLIAEVEDLRAENARFRGLLGLDERPDDGHTRAWAPMLLTEPADQTNVDASSTSEEVPAADRRGVHLPLARR
jgi:hypothetical protein